MNGKTIYGLNPYCDVEFDGTGKDKYRAIYRLHYEVWEQALLRRLGSLKDVNAARIIILYTADDGQCVYPASKMQTNQQTRDKKADLFNKVENSAKGVFIERNEPFIFDK